MRISAPRPDQNGVDVWKTRFVELECASHALAAAGLSNGTSKEVVGKTAAVRGWGGYSGGDALDGEGIVVGGDAGEEVEVVRLGRLCEEPLELGKGRGDGDVHGGDGPGLWIVAGEDGGVEMEEDGACEEVSALASQCTRTHSPCRR